jgi:hypothetical protein
MQRAKAFFFVCAGLCLLALSFHLGARSARAQAPGPGWFFAGAYAGSTYITTTTGDTWAYNGATWSGPWNIFGGASRTIVSMVPGEALTSTGEVWYNNSTYAIGTFTNAGVPPIGPTPAKQASFGALKAKYR